jgi:hypothetical protein
MILAERAITGDLDRTRYRLPAPALDPGNRLSHFDPMPVKFRKKAALFFSTPDSLPAIGDAERASAGLQHWNEQIAKLEDLPEIKFARSLPDDPLAGRLLRAIFANSPFLTQCILRDIGFLVHLLRTGPDLTLREVIADLKTPGLASSDRQTLMQRLRISRRRAASPPRPCRPAYLTCYAKRWRATKLCCESPIGRSRIAAS